MNHALTSVLDSSTQLVAGGDVKNVDSFAARSEAIVFERTVPNFCKMPKKVKYDTKCGLSCRDEHSGPTMSFKQFLTKTIQDTVKRHCPKGKAGNLAAANVLLALDFGSARPIFVAGTDGTGRAGIFEEQESFVLHYVTSGQNVHPFAELVLRARREEFVPRYEHTELRSPLQQGELAGLGIFTDWDIDSLTSCLLYTSPSPRDATLSRMPSSA